MENFRGNLTRRALLSEMGLGLGSIALGSLLGRDALAKTAGASAAKPHHRAKAKRVICLHMVGAPSQLDLFDPKPALTKYDGQLLPDHLLEGQRFAFLRGHPRLMASPYKFTKHGKSGMELSELLPHLGGVADRLTMVRSMHTSEFNHGPAQVFFHSGFGRFGRPSMGSWVTYGLGTENQNLPSFVVMVSGPVPGAGKSLWSSGFLPSIHQGVEFRGDGDPVLFLSNPKGISPADRRRTVDSIKQLNRMAHAQTGDPEIMTRVQQYEMAFRMQSAVPELMDIASEPARVREMYGVTPGKPSFANNCLLARRLVERGVRFVQLYDADWDHHGAIHSRLPKECGRVDRPAAALIKDLAQRGLLEDTLVIWAAEFGRTPMVQIEDMSDSPANERAPGRDHHKDAFTIWMAGGGLKPGLVYGATDDLGFHISKNPVHVHDLHATILHLLGMDHERLTFKFQGRDYRLTDVAGNVVKDLIA